MATTVPGTLSFLFADLRDYTAFVEKHGDAAAAGLIADYRALVRREVAKTGGGEIKTEGDSFYVVFPTARQALQCAIGVLRSAERHNRGRPDRPIRAGIGVHVGEPVPHEGQYVGSAVNVAARCAGAAGPGELLVSEVVRGILRTGSGPQMQEREGVVLKGVQDPPRVFAVAWQEPASPAHASAPAVVAIEAAPPVNRRILCPELVGREDELARLAAFLRDVAAGGGKTALVAGEAGLGKSALLRAFADRARAAGARFLLGECTEVEARRPFGPFVEILRAAFRDLSAGSGEQALRSTAAGLLGLLPELERADVAPTELAETERYRVHAAIAQLIADLAGRQPLVVIVEDLHWADEATLELFPYLARKLRDRPVLLLGTYRTDERHRLHPLNHLLAELARGRIADEVRLPRLTLEETGKVVRAALGLNRSPTPEFLAAIQERCEGNPFFIEEVLKALVERGDLSYRDGAWQRTKEVPALAIPVSIRDAMQQRMRLLTPEARRAVQIAAVIGQRFDFELLRRVAALPEAAVVGALRLAVDAQLVEEVPDHGAEELYGFRHALTRESVLAELLQRERRLLHRAVGEAIEAVATADPATSAEELAYHFDEARDAERARRYHELAAGEALRVFAFARATHHLERAVELAADDYPSLGELQLRLAEAAAMASDFPRAVRAAEQALRHFEARGDVRARGRTLGRLSVFRWLVGETREATAAADEAVRLLQPLGDTPELAAACASLARLAMLDGRDAESAPWAERAIALARATGATDVLADALITKGTLASHVGEDDAAALREGLELALRHEFLFLAARAYQNLWAITVRGGATGEELRRIHEENAAHSRRYGLRWITQIQRDCGFAFGDGDWDAALRFVEEGRGDSIWSASMDVVEALMMTARQGPGEGLRRLEAPYARLHAAGDAQWVSYADGFGAATVLLAGDAERALRYAEGVAPFLAKGYWNPPVDIGAVCALVAARRRGDEEALARWIERSGAPGVRSNPAEARRAFARAERSVGAGDLDAALAELERSGRLLSELPWSVFMSTFPRLRRAELLLRGDREGAAAELAAALPYWRKAKATWYLGRLGEWARERGLAFRE